MTVYRLSEAAHLLAVSDDTLRRWVDAGKVTADRTVGGYVGIEGRALAALARELADIPAKGSVASSQRVSARNQLHGIVTAVRRDTVMAQVELCCGPYRVVSLMSREAADSLGLDEGVVAVASIKATNVVVELPR